MKPRRRPAHSLRPAGNLSLHFVGEGGLLLDQARHRLYALNASAALIWCLLQDGKPPAEICRLLVEQYAVPADQAASFVDGVVQQCEQLGRGETARQPTLATSMPAKPDIAAHPRHAAAIATYALLGSAIRVRYESDRSYEAIHPLLQHRALPGVSATNTIDVVSHDAGIAVISENEVIGSSGTLEEAAVAVRACLTQLATTRSGGLCVVHAGALRRDNAALLLPGNAGDGKSTLSAGLARSGFDMLCDDTTLLAGEPPLVRCIPSGLCIKRGAYDVLRPHYPHLDALPEWRRPDGKHARYLMPDRDLDWAPSESAVGVRWMVFPRYHSDHDTRLLPVPRHDALARLLPGVCFLSGTLDGHNLDTLIAWIERIDCFDLPLSCLDEATALIDGLCR